MKGHKAHHHAKAAKHHAKGGEVHYLKGVRHCRAEGGEVESPKEGDREYEEDLSHNPEARDNAHEIEGEAEERKHGGRAKRKRGGHVHHEHGKHLGHAKHVGHVEGKAMHHHAGRKPRKSGGRSGSNMNPLSSAHAGVLPPHHKDAEID